MTQCAKVFYKIILAFFFLGFLILALPPTCNLVIELVQRLIERELRDPGRWIEIIQHCSSIAMCAIALVFWLCFTDKGINFSCKIKQEMRPFLLFVASKSFAVMLLGTAAFYSFCFFKVIDSDFYYADDLWRSYDGSRSWIGFSRYISEFLSIVLHNNIYLPDIAPLTQFLAIAVMSFTTLLLAWIVTDGKVTIASIIICSLLFLSPFNAQNISYRFDSPYMALSAFFPIIPFLFKGKKSLFLFTSILCIILCSMSYQAGTSIYILMTIYFAVKMWLDKEEPEKIFSFAGIAVLAFVVALLLFKFLFMNTLSNSSEDYFSAKLSISAIPFNIQNYISTTSSLFGGVWTKVFLVTTVIVAFLGEICSTGRNKILAALFLVLVSIAAYILSFGPYLIFERPLIAPRAFTGFNMLVALIGISVYTRFYCNASIKIGKKRAALLPALCLIYGCIVFLFAYGTSLSEQKQYQSFRAELLLSDLSKIAPEDEKKYISFSGSIGLTEGIHISTDEYPLIVELMPVVPGGGIWNEELLCSYNFYCEDEYIKGNPGWPLLEETYYHDIYGYGNHFFIELKEY